MSVGQGAPLIELAGITKRFGGVVALNQVNVHLERGEIVGLVGDNGAGKSTLIKVMAGAYQPDGGTIRFEGREVALNTPRAAKELGIETVYQDLALVDTLDVPGNIFLGRELLRLGVGPIKVLNKRRMAQEAETLLREVGLTLPSLQAEVGWLSGGQRQSVAISRALYTDPKLVILDEPTAALAVREVENVLALTQALKQRDIAVVYISHTLQEVLSIADRVVVLRKGEKVADLAAAATSLDEVVKYIVGHGGGGL